MRIILSVLLSLALIPSIRQRPEWNRFIIFVWQYQTDVLRDKALYEQAGLHAFHIDRGDGEDELVKFSIKNNFPYYVDHAAGKGILYLSNSLRPQVTGKRDLLIRPRSLADPNVIKELQDLLRANISTTQKGLAYAYAFDDEISLGSFNSPAEVDVHPLSIARYHQWLSERYGTIARLNASWGTSYESFNDVQPVSFEDVRKSANSPPFANWNLSRWMEWRHFMDYQFAKVLSDLTQYANKLDPRIPAGFVGGQQPSAYGGYDYAYLSRAVQWMEGSDELLRSFWNRPRRPHVQTYNITGSVTRDTWTLWYRLAHGDQAGIAWPDGWFRTDSLTGKRMLTKEIQELAPVFREIQGPASEFIVNPDTHLETDPIGIYYSHPSIRAGWVMDSITHGSTWPNRASSLDDENSSSAHLRSSWCRLLEDLGYQYDFISYLDVQEKKIDLNQRFKVIVLPQTICLSDVEVEALRSFVKSGGILIADDLTGLLTDTGRGRKQGALDDLFGIVRDESKGYLDGRGLTEIDAEYGNKPFQDRLRAYPGSLHKGPLVVFERGTQQKIQNSRAIYLNLTPLAYEHWRNDRPGQEWRTLIGNTLKELGVPPRIMTNLPFVESLLWRNGDRYVLAIVKNSEGETQRTGQQIRIQLGIDAKNIRNIRTGKALAGPDFTDEFNPCEANLYGFTGPR